MGIEPLIPISTKPTPVLTDRVPDEDGFPEKERVWIELSQSIRRIEARGRGLAAISLAFCALTLSTFGLPAIQNDANDAAATDQLYNWPHFRGPGAIGRAYHANPPLTWSLKAGKNVLWKVKIPKPGMNSPVVWGNRLFLTGADESSRQVFCFETDTGKLLWQHDVADIAASPSKDKLPKVMETSGLAAPTARLGNQPTLLRPLLVTGST